MTSMKKLSSMKKAANAINISFIAEGGYVQAVIPGNRTGPVSRHCFKLRLEEVINSTPLGFAHLSLDAKMALLMYYLEVGQESTRHYSTPTLLFSTII